jgi:type II secretory pathway pseudopilin PulG
MNDVTTLKARQAGATLVVGLMLLLVLTVIGVSGMNTATMEVRMASNTQVQQDAFQLAEDGIDLAIGQKNFTTVGAQTIAWLNDPNYDRMSVTTFRTTTPVPDIAFSGGVAAGGVQAFHFDSISVGRGARNATSTHTQSFYVVGPSGP